MTTLIRKIPRIITSRIFIAAVSAFIGAASALNIQFMLEEHYISHHLEDEEELKYITQTLDQKGILYEYKVDHLKRHWITPYVNDDSIMVEIENQYLLRKK